MSSAIRPFISGVGYGPHRIAQSRSGGKVVVENGSAHDEAMDDGSAQIAAIPRRLCKWVISDPLPPFPVGPGTGRERKERLFAWRLSGRVKSIQSAVPVGLPIAPTSLYDFLPS
jgi:hypothetical protein